MLRTVFALPKEFHVLIVDDGSPDGTGAKVKELQAEFGEKLHLLEREGKLGLGTAYIAGFKYCLAKGYEYIFEMDCDFSHPTDKLIELYSTCHDEGKDFAVGSRYTEGGGFVNWSWDRAILSRFASFYVQSILGIGIKDSTAGFMCYTAKVLKAIDLDNIQFIGYAFQIEMKYKAKLKGFTFKEVPIVFTDRTLGESKMNQGIIKEAVFGVWKLRKVKA